jgi:hypothetical protein
MSDSGGFDPLVDIAPCPTAMAITEPDVVGAGGINSALPLGCPVVQRRDGYASQVMDLFGGEHLTTVGQGFRHGDSLRVVGDEAERPALR